MTASPVTWALIGGTAAALATTAGALGGVVLRRISTSWQDGMLGFGAGVMLAATSFSLILPGIESASALGLGPWGAGILVMAAMFAGAAAILAMDVLIPHEHFVKGLEGPAARRLKRTWLFVIAICLHNVPEGLAIGVGYVGGREGGHALATGIAIQDVPEGLAVVVSLAAAGYRRTHALAVGAFSGLLEPIGALVGALVVASVPPLLPVGLALAAGAMLWVVSHEVIPESHRQGHERSATTGLMLGFGLMMLLDTALG